MRRVAPIVAGLLVAACGPLVSPTMPEVASSVHAAFQGRNMTFTVTPWPLDDSVAFLCLRKPTAFEVDHPTPEAGAGCMELEADTDLGGNTLRATFSEDDLKGDLAQQFGRSRPPWFLAVYGSRASFTVANVLTVVDSPIPSDAGPS